MRQKVAEEHVCATSAYNPCIAAMVHHHSITAFATESCSTLKLCCGAHRAGRCHDDGRYNRRQHSPSALCAGAKKSHSHTWRELRANHQVVSMILPETGYMGMIAVVLPIYFCQKKEGRRSCFCCCWSSSLFFSFLTSSFVLL